MADPEPGFRKPSRAVIVGVALGALIELPTLAAAIASAGAGHGDYVAARALFPVPMLATRLEGSIGWLSGGAALLQFPIYGALLGWSRLREALVAPMLVAAVHLVAALACFAGALPHFS